jgi:RimJ/RimL family protein N-acetyltransferase
MITTQRLELRPLSREHVGLIHDMSVDPEVRRYLWEGQIISEAEVEAMVSASEACFEKFGTGFYVLYITIPDDPNDGAFVGFCGHRIFEDGNSMELLFGMKQKFWGRGFGQEAAREVLRHGFEACDIQRVLAATDTPNERSVRVLRRLGMSFADRRLWHGLDTVFYEITAAEFGDATSH